MVCLTLYSRAYCHLCEDMQRELETLQPLFGFDLHDSDLPLRTAFPILVDHLSSWLLPEAVVPRPYRPDESVLISPDVHATAVRVVTPSGRGVDLAVRQGSTVSAQVFADTPLNAGTSIKAVHLTQLRSALDQARAKIGIPAVIYTDPAIASGTMTIKAAHVADLRNGVK